VDRFRLLRCQLSVDEVWWERTERLDVCTVPVVRDKGCRWIPRDGVCELVLVVDLDRWVFHIPGGDGFTDNGHRALIFDSMCYEHITPNR
jgi:hypothetical protein